MAIKNISRAKFNRIFTFDRELARYIGEEFELYVDDVESVIGTIARGISDSCWSYTILRRNVLGDFLVSTLSRDFIDLQTARVVCLRDMTAAYVDQDMVVSQRD